MRYANPTSAARTVSRRPFRSASRRLGRAACEALESLEPRRLMSGGDDLSVSLSKTGTLRVTGTDADDHITVKKWTKGSKEMGVRVVGDDLSKTFRKSPFKRLTVDARGGDDTIDVSALSKRATVTGGAGYDALYEGSNTVGRGTEASISTAAPPSYVQPDETVDVQLPTPVGPSNRLRPIAKVDFTVTSGVEDLQLQVLEAEANDGLAPEDRRYYYLPPLLMDFEDDASVDDQPTVKQVSKAVRMKMYLDFPSNHIPRLAIAEHIRKLMPAGTKIRPEQVSIVQPEVLRVEATTSDGEIVRFEDVEQLIDRARFDLTARFGSSGGAAAFADELRSGNVQLRVATVFQGYGYRENRVTLSWKQLQQSKVFKELTSDPASNAYVTRDEVGELVSDALGSTDILIEQEFENADFAGLVDQVTNALFPKQLQISLDNMKDLVDQMKRYGMDPNDLKSDILTSYAEKIERNSDEYRKFEGEMNTAFNASVSVPIKGVPVSFGGGASHVTKTLEETSAKYGLKWELNKEGTMFVPKSLDVRLNEVRTLKENQAIRIGQRTVFQSDGQLVQSIDADRGVRDLPRIMNVLQGQVDEWERDSDEDPTFPGRLEEWEREKAEWEEMRGAVLDHNERIKRTTELGAITGDRGRVSDAYSSPMLPVGEHIRQVWVRIGDCIASIGFKTTADRTWESPIKDWDRIVEVNIDVAAGERLVGFIGMGDNELVNLGLVLDGGPSGRRIEGPFGYITQRQRPQIVADGWEVTKIFGGVGGAGDHDIDWIAATARPIHNDVKSDPGAFPIPRPTPNLSTGTFLVLTPVFEDDLDQRPYPLPYEDDPYFGGRPIW